jgi:large subunit ribosomal protein L4
MASIAVRIVDFEKDKVDFRNIDLSPAIEVESAKSMAYVVRWQLAGRRSGSAKTKTMAEISGTTAKPHKQKGTGRARQGSKRSVQFVGGRTCHGPMPRSFDFSMPKKIVKKALIDTLRLKLRQDKVVLFSDFNPEVKTSRIGSVLAKNNIISVLIVCHNPRVSLVKSVRNLKNVKILNARAMNVYDILKFDHLMVDDKVFEKNILGAIA